MGYRWFFNTGGGAVMTMVLYMVFLRRDAAHPLGILNREGYAQYGVMAADRHCARRPGARAFPPTG